MNETLSLYAPCIVFSAPHSGVAFPQPSPIPSTAAAGVFSGLPYLLIELLVCLGANKVLDDLTGRMLHCDDQVSFLTGVF